VKPQQLQWLTGGVELRQAALDYPAVAGVNPSRGLLAAVAIAANALILNSLFTISACNA
jgi:hypothetical protein